MSLGTYSLQLLQALQKAGGDANTNAVRIGMNQLFRCGYTGSQNYTVASGMVTLRNDGYVTGYGGRWKFTEMGTETLQSIG